MIFEREQEEGPPGVQKKNTWKKKSSEQNHIVTLIYFKAVSVRVDGTKTSTQAVLINQISTLSIQVLFPLK